eukprot:15187541-Ditylum_brightwellii.AAC.1
MKYKACLYVHCGTQKWGMGYGETYSPVVNWISVRILLAIAAMHDLLTSLIDFVLAFPQAALDVVVFMKLPIGIDVPQGNSKEYVLHLNKSIYVLKQGILTWFSLLSMTSQKKSKDFKPSMVDPCIFIQSDCILLVYMNDVLIIGKTKHAISNFISLLKSGEEGFQFTNQGTVENYLRVEIVQSACDNSFELRQMFPIKCLIKMIGLTPDVKGRENLV